MTKMGRLDYVELAHQQQGKVTLWGAKGPNEFDCSGLVTWTLRELGGPDWTEAYSARRLWLELPTAPQPTIGDLAFYGPSGSPNHVMIYTGGGKVFGACGATSKITDIDTARKDLMRRVKERLLNYRPDFIGYRSLATYLE